MRRNTPNVGYINPEVANNLEKWELVSDVVSGETVVKAKGEKYLPKPETTSDRKLNNKIYEKYKLRALLVPIAERTLEGLNGQVFSKPAEIELTSEIDSMLDNVDGMGLSLEQQAKLTLSEVIQKGRHGLLSDFPRVQDTNN